MHSPYGIGSRIWQHTPSTNTKNALYQDVFLPQYFLHFSTHSLTLSEIQQCSGYATGIFPIHFLLFSSRWNKAALIQFCRGKEVHSASSCFTNSLSVSRKEKKKRMQVKWNLLVHQTESHLKSYFLLRMSFKGYYIHTVIKWWAGHTWICPTYWGKCTWSAFWLRMGESQESILGKRKA